MGITAVKNFKKKMMFVFVFALILIGFMLFFTSKASAASYRAGDILITSSTSFKFAGHAGIVGRSGNGRLYAVHIPGPGKPIQKISLSSWKRNYPKTEIWRHKHKTAANKAGNKAMDFARYYGNKTTFIAPYSLTGSAAWTLKNKNKTYCSKLVWQSYYYGPGYNLGVNPNKYGIVAPYSLRGLPNMYKVSGSL
ncbi:MULTISPECIES: YiiX/YebB-like N1pC/P60 family cysteine hydrolase [Clostridia]|uniref:YiiX/YebB-like N1pC/P60 family cysteine hydrolase n=1 Tax=Clostridia TaxID=186801 RepID=UPI000EA17ED8|nr:MULTISPECIES: YiiX/YebB-like N1pC/P60 family cysteine hydrolase [Clostridia]NBJ71377.1 hypothetical protein [Roseburia sp. 1XD42-34]RKI74466.1 hypothetical protein D7V87_18715 [Clostridium sp. 1xD42-85]